MFRIEFNINLSQLYCCTLLVILNCIILNNKVLDDIIK